jgi:hypothetical protein
MYLTNPYLITAGIIALLIQIIMIMLISYKFVYTNKLLRSLSVASFFAIIMVGWSCYQSVLGFIYNYSIIIGITYYEYTKDIK